VPTVRTGLEAAGAARLIFEGGATDASITRCAMAIDAKNLTGSES
jgi:hypothetical protein